MTKKQKILGGVFLGMFLIPEILWGPLLGILHFLVHSPVKPLFSDVDLINNSIFIAESIIIIEILGLIGLFKLNINFNKTRNYYYLLNFIISVLIIGLIFTGYFAFSLNSMFS